MPASEHLDTTVQATTAVKSGVPAGDEFSPEVWQEFERLVRALEEAVARLHPAAHSAADAHSAHAQRTSQRVERRAGQANQAGEKFTAAGTAVDQAQGNLGVHQDGTDEHAAAQAAHQDAQAAHTDAQAAHELAQTRHSQAQEAHEKATRHAQASAQNRERVDAIKAILEELIADLRKLQDATSHLGPEATPEAQAEAKAQHQATKDRVATHGAKLEEHLGQVDRESLDEPEDDSAEDQD